MQNKKLRRKKLRAFAASSGMRISIAKPYIPDADVKRILKDTEKILRSGRLYQGPYLEAFEHEFAKAAGTKYAVGLNSGTSALEVALKYFDVHGREVITPTNTFIATSNAVIYAGGKPVLADIHPDTLCLDPKDIEKRITKKTKGIILVHVNGLITPHIKAIRALCKRRKLFLIEDGAHAHGARIFGKPAGSWGDAAAFSCLATKPITTGGVGGVLATDDSNLVFFARSLRFHGEDTTRGIQNRLGNNWFLSEMQAAFGLSQVKRIHEIVRKRMNLAKTYDKAFSKLKRVEIFKLPKGALHSYYKYPLLLKKPLTKDAVAAELKTRGISVGGAYWLPCHLQPVYKKLFKFKKGDFPVAEDILSRTIALPMYTGMTKQEINYVIREVKERVSKEVREVRSEAKVTKV